MVRSTIRITYLLDEVLKVVSRRFSLGLESLTTFFFFFFFFK
jgi:hypothetical protein